MKKFLLFLTLIIVTGLSAQQNGTIQGNLTDLESFNEPLLMADVAIKGTEFKTKTNLHGNFELAGIEPGAYTLRMSFLGYETVELSIEVAANSTTHVAQGLKAQSLDLGDIAALLSEETTDHPHAASIEKAN